MAIAHGGTGSAYSGGGPSVVKDSTGWTLIVAYVGSYIGEAGASMADDKGNSWTPDTDQANTPGGYSRARIFFCIPTSVGSGHTFTYSGSSVYATLIIDGFTGTKSSSVFDQHNGAKSAGASSLKPGSVTPSENNELVLTGCAAYLTSSWAVDAGFTKTSEQTLTTGIDACAAYLIQTTAAAADPTWTPSTSVDIASTIGTFKSAAGGGGGTVFTLQHIYRHVAGIGA